MDPLQIILQGGAHVHQAADYLTLTSHQDGSEVFLGLYDYGPIGRWTTGGGLYSYNKVDWNEFELGENYVPNAITLNNGEKVYIKINTVYDDLGTTEANRFMLTGKIKCSGDLLSSLFLNETELKTNMFRFLFSNCTGLIEAPSLPYTNLHSYCYAYMFTGCTSLVAAPKLPAKTLEPYCYMQMFHGCTNLQEITISANDITAPNACDSWLVDVAEEGVFHNLGTATYPSGSSGKPSGWTEVHS